MPADHVEVILIGRDALGSPVEARPPQPGVGLIMTVDDGAALRCAQDFRGVERKALHLAEAEHPACKSASAIPDRQRLELILASPDQIFEFDAVTGVYDRLRYGAIGFRRDGDLCCALPCVPSARQKDRHRATVRCHGVFRAGVAADRGFEITHRLKWFHAATLCSLAPSNLRSSSTLIRRAFAEHLPGAIDSCFFSHAGRPVT